MRMSSQLACALEPTALRVVVEADLGIALLLSPMRSRLCITPALLSPWCLPAKSSTFSLPADKCCSERFELGCHNFALTWTDAATVSYAGIREYGIMCRFS